jgi:hypothetical protein
MIYKFANGKKSGVEYETSLYESGKRTGKNAHVYKLKVDITDEGQEEQLEEEGLIIGFYAAKGTQKEAIMFKLLDQRGNQFKCGIEGTIESRQKLYKKALKDKTVVIGKYLEYKYQELSDTGVPTMAVGLNIRDEDDVDVSIVKKFKKLIKKLDINLEDEDEDEDDDEEDEDDKKPTKNKTTKKKEDSEDEDDKKPTKNKTTKKKENTSEIDEERLNSEKKSKENPNPYTLVELKIFAKELGIEKYSKMNKAELVDVIKEKL